MVVDERFQLLVFEWETFGVLSWLLMGGDHVHEVVTHGSLTVFIICTVEILDNRKIVETKCQRSNCTMRTRFPLTCFSLYSVHVSAQK